MASSKVMPDTGFVDMVIEVFKMLRASWEAFRLNASSFIFLIFIPWVVTFACLILSFGASFTGNIDDKIHVNVPWLIVTVALLILVLIFFMPAVTYTQLISAKGKRVKALDALKNSRKFVLRYLALNILLGLGIIFGLILLIIPGLLIAFFLSFSSYVLIDKNKGINDTFKLCYKMVRANWKFVAAYLVVEVIINMLMSITGRIPVMGLIVYAVLFFGYFCLPALVYTKISK